MNFLKRQNASSPAGEQSGKGVQGSRRNPLFIESAKGSKIYDVDGNEYIDYVLSWGPMILGHSHPAVVKALQKATEKGTSFGAPTPLEVELAEMVRKAYPSMEVMRMVNSAPRRP